MLDLSRFNKGLAKNSDLMSLFVGFRFDEFLSNLIAMGRDDTDWRRAGIGLWVVNVTLTLKRDSAQTECEFVFFFPQTETLSSLKALLKHIDQTQLTRDLEGTFHYDHNHWIHFRQVSVTEVAGP